MTPQSQADAAPDADADDATVIGLSQDEPEHFTSSAATAGAEVRLYRALARLSPTCATRCCSPPGATCRTRRSRPRSGVPVGTVRSRLSRARGKLRQYLGDTDPSALAEEPQTWTR